MRLQKSTVKVNCCLLGKPEADFAPGEIILQKREQKVSQAVSQSLLCQMKASLSPIHHLSIYLYIDR